MEPSCGPTPTAEYHSAARHIQTRLLDARSVSEIIAERPSTIECVRREVKAINIPIEMQRALVRLICEYLSKPAIVSTAASGRKGEFVGAFPSSSRQGRIGASSPDSESGIVSIQGIIDEPSLQLQFGRALLRTRSGCRRMESDRRRR